MVQALDLYENKKERKKEGVEMTATMSELWKENGQWLWSEGCITCGTLLFLSICHTLVLLKLQKNNSQAFNALCQHIATLILSYRWSLAHFNKAIPKKAQNTHSTGILFLCCLDVYACISRKPHGQTSIFRACWLWLSLVFFWLWGWCHVFIQWATYSVVLNSINYELSASSG